jgi:phage-related tail fiber protein
MAVIIDGTKGINKVQDGCITSESLADSIRLPGTPTAATAPVGTNNDQIATTGFVAMSVPAGLVSFFARNTAPAGWLKANGAVVSRTTYANLFAAIGTTFGAGDGSTTFNLPDLRGEFLRVWDDGRAVDTGRVFGTWQDSGNKWHNHGGVTGGISNDHTHDTSLSTIVNDGSHFDNGNGAEVTTADVGSTINTYGSSANHSHGITGDGLSEARPRNIALLACIKY